MAAPGQVVRRRALVLRRLAGRRDRRRQHPRPVRGPAAHEADRGGRRRPADRHGARRRLPLHVSALPGGCRAPQPAQPAGLVGVPGGGAVGVVLTVGGEPAARRRARAARPTTSCAPAPRRPPRPCRSARTAVWPSTTAATTRRSTSAPGSSPRDGAAVERPAGSIRRTRPAGGRAGRPRRHAWTPTSPTRCGCSRCRCATAARQLATVVTSTSLAPYRQVQRLAWFGSAALAVGAAGRGPPGAAGQRRRGRCARCSEMSAQAEPVERRRRRAAGSGRRRARPSSTTWPAPWTGCSTGSRRCCGGSGSSPTS